MFPRSTKMATEAAEVYEILSGDNPAQSLINVLSRARADPLSHLGHRGAPAQRRAHCPLARRRPACS
jgi:hypothetical protein